MRRCAFLLALSALTASMAMGQAIAQPTAKTRRVAFLDQYDRAGLAVHWQVFRQRLQELGYTDGKNLIVDARWANYQPGRLAALAQELVAARPDVIVTMDTPTTRAAMQATSAIPIVFTNAADPVGERLVQSLARPGGNATGASIVSTDTAGKRIELLREISPGAKQFGLLGPRANSAVVAIFRQLERAAALRTASVRLLDAGDSSAIDAAFANLEREPVDALIVAAALIGHRQQIALLAVRHRVPVIYPTTDFLEAGGLLAFGPDTKRQFLQAADYVHRILNGARPAELPVVQPTAVPLGVNLTAAKAIGISIPPSLRIRADRVIE
jgi:putative ABC transport system substrate-binding protein